MVRHFLFFSCSILDDDLLMSIPYVSFVFVSFFFSTGSPEEGIQSVSDGCRRQWRATTVRLLAWDVRAGDDRATGARGDRQVRSTGDGIRRSSRRAAAQGGGTVSGTSSTLVGVCNVEGVLFPTVSFLVDDASFLCSCRDARSAPKVIITDIADIEENIWSPRYSRWCLSTYHGVWKVRAWFLLLYRHFIFILCSAATSLLQVWHQRENWSYGRC